MSESEVDEALPDATDYYKAGLAASAITYCGILVLIAVAGLIGGDDLGASVSQVLFFGMMGLIPALGIAMMLAAPLGCAIGIALRAVLPSSHWQGALNGAITAAALFAVPALVLSARTRVPDVGTLVFIGGVILVASGAGWIAQRFVLNWPSAETKPSPRD